MLALVGTLDGAVSLHSPGSNSNARPPVTPTQYEKWQTELSNWGRWGKDDELGTLNLFAHRFFGGKMWNGYPVSGFVTREGGAMRNSVLTMKGGIVTRAVLYDLPRLKGVPYLEPGTRIIAEDLEAWERKAGVRVGDGSSC